VVPAAREYGLEAEYEYLRPSIKQFPTGGACFEIRVQLFRAPSSTHQEPCARGCVCEAEAAPSSSS